MQILEPAALMGVAAVITAKSGLVWSINGQR